MILEDVFTPDQADAIRRELARSEVAFEQRLRERWLLTVSEFATVSGRTEKSVRRRLERGEIQFVKEGARVMIPAFEIGRC